MWQTALDRPHRRRHRHADRRRPRLHLGLFRRLDRRVIRGLPDPDADPGAADPGRRSPARSTSATSRSSPWRSIVVLLAWMGPTLVIRSQVLTMKERQFVSVAKLSGVGDLGIIFKEILPNLLPFIAAAFVAQVFAAVFASFYLAVLGLGPLREPLLGNIIWAAQGAGRVLQRLVVVADRAGAGDDPDPRLARPHQYGARRARQSARAQVGIMTMSRRLRIARRSAAPRRRRGEPSRCCRSRTCRSPTTPTPAAPRRSTTSASR